ENRQFAKIIEEDGAVMNRETPRPQRPLLKQKPTFGQFAAVHRTFKSVGRLCERNAARACCRDAENSIQCSAQQSMDLRFGFGDCSRWEISLGHQGVRTFLAFEGMTVAIIMLTCLCQPRLSCHDH